MTINALMKAVDAIVSHVSKVSKEWPSKKEIEELIHHLLFSKRVFVIGAGRSGLVGKAFAMRLMHLDIEVYVVGETITPSIAPGDVLIAISGGGETAYVCSVAKTAKNNGAKVIALTSYPESTLGKIADVEIKGRKEILGEDYITRQISGEHLPLTPLGTLFEVTAMIFLDGIIAELIKRTGKTERDLKIRHTNLE